MGDCDSTAGGAGTGGPSVPTVVSADCERSVRLLMVTLAIHRREEAALATGSAQRGRLKVSMPDTVRRRVRRENVLVRSLSILESFVQGELINWLALLVPQPRTALVEELYAQFEERGTMSWDSMATYFKKHVHHSIKLRGAADWDKVNAVIEARNAVVHGLGRFTVRQSRRGVSKQVVLPLEGLGFEVSKDGSRLLVTAAALESTVALLRDYMEWLDLALAGVKAETSS